MYDSYPLDIRLISLYQTTEDFLLREAGFLT